MRNPILHSNYICTLLSHFIWLLRAYAIVGIFLVSDVLMVLVRVFDTMVHATRTYIRLPVLYMFTAFRYLTFAPLFPRLNESRCEIATPSKTSEPSRPSSFSLSLPLSFLADSIDSDLYYRRMAASSRVWRGSSTLRRSLKRLFASRRTVVVITPCSPIMITETPIGTTTNARYTSPLPRKSPLKQKAVIG